MASDRFNPLQGMSDISFPEVAAWQHLESASRQVLHRYGFQEVRTPLLERQDVFIRSLGETTDVVQKEMYTLEDRGGRRLALRPEGTAGVIRHVAGLGQDGANARLYYMGPMFRAERPQAGRKRQFHQVGVEAIGDPDPVRDAEVIALQVEVLREAGLKDVEVSLNTRGTAEDQRNVQSGLREALEPFRADLPEESRNRMDGNILRVVDAKDEASQAVLEQIPPVTTWMSTESLEYLDEVGGRLEDLKIPFSLKPRLVRGLDYYEHTIWEISHASLGAQDALAGGGRYAISMGNRTIRGVGFALGMERTLMALAAEGQAVKPSGPDLFLASLGEAAHRENLKFMQALRGQGVHVRMDLHLRNMKKQMNEANRLDASWVGIRGDAELEQGVLQLKNMDTGDQTAVPVNDVIHHLLSTS